MAWPKGKPRKMAKVEQSAPVPVPVVVEASPQAAQDATGSTIATEPDFDLGKVRRAICAHYVRLQPIPRSIRIHNYLPLSRIAAGIRRQMAKDGAPDSEVEAYVAKHVR